MYIGVQNNIFNFFKIFKFKFKNYGQRYLISIKMNENIIVVNMKIYKR